MTEWDYNYGYYSENGAGILLVEGHEACQMEQHSGRSQLAVQSEYGIQSYTIAITTA